MILLIVRIILAIGVIILSILHYSKFNHLRLMPYLYLVLSLLTLTLIIPGYLNLDESSPALEIYTLIFLVIAFITSVSAFVYHLSKSS